MDTNLHHEDLLIKLRAKLNEERIKLWEPPYILPDNSISESLQELSKKLSSELSVPENTVLLALHELQLHSIDRSKANSEFKETGVATFRVKATIPGETPRVLRIQRKLDSVGSDLIADVANELCVSESRIKLIFSGKIIQPAMSLEEQNVKNGAQIMALLMTYNPEEAKRQDSMYLQMKSTRDDAALLSEYVDDFELDEYIKLEDQSGKTVELPPAERRALMVGLALHQRGRAAAREKDYPLALLLLLEADRQLSECSSSILSSVDNVAVVQLDIAWCYLCLRSLAAASDAAARLARAERALRASYGEHGARLLALKGTDANERALMMRLHLMQGIVSYHQNKRDEARRLLDQAEAELNSLRVDGAAVAALEARGWSAAQARRGLRAAGGVARAHRLLRDTRAARDAARRGHRDTREHRALGTCLDGTLVKKQLVEALMGMGYGRRLATLALRNSNNHVAEAVRLIQEQPELLDDSDLSDDGTESQASEHSLVEPDNRLVGELEAMGYDPEQAKGALIRARNHISGAVDLLVAGGGRVDEEHTAMDADPSTSTSEPDPAKKERRRKKEKREKKRRERDQAFDRLSAAIRTDEDDHLDTSLVEEEEFLVQYKSLL